MTDVKIKTHYGDKVELGRIRSGNFLLQVDAHDGVVAVVLDEAEAAQLLAGLLELGVKK